MFFYRNFDFFRKKTSKLFAEKKKSRTFALVIDWAMV